MKKTLLLAALAILLAGCSQEKAAFEAAVLDSMKKDSDLKDYQINPEIMADCIISMTSKRMPGIASFDPRRTPYYGAYTKLIQMNASENPEATLDETAEVFGSKKEAMKAYLGYSQNVMNCISAVVAQNGGDEE